MFWGPGRIQAGKRVARAVGQIDFMPTILDIAGVPKPAQVRGASLTDLLRDAKVDASDVDRPLFSEGWGAVAIGANYELAEFAPPAYLVQIGTQKLMQYRRHGGFEYEYYDLTKDAGERHNADDPTSRHIASMRERLAEYDNDCMATAVALSTQSGSTRAATPKAVQLSPAEGEKLRALGYLK
jgi:arylsulfatase A-like enzyme